MILLYLESFEQRFGRNGKFLSKRCSKSSCLDILFRHIQKLESTMSLKNENQVELNGLSLAAYRGFASIMEFMGIPTDRCVHMTINKRLCETGSQDITITASLGGNRQQPVVIAEARFILEKGEGGWVFLNRYGVYMTLIHAQEKQKTFSIHCPKGVPYCWARDIDSADQERERYQRLLAVA